MTPAVSSRDDALQRLAAALPRLRDDFGVERLALFGSFALDQVGSASDIDLLVESSQPLGLRFVALAGELEALLGRTVHLATFDAVRRAARTPERKALVQSIAEHMIDIDPARHEGAEGGCR